MEDISKRTIGKIMGSGVGVAGGIQKLNGASGAWKHVDTKFGLHNAGAEQHRKVLQANLGTNVKKILENLKIKKWNFYAKVRGM